VLSGESWSQYFNPSAEPLNKRLTRTLLGSAVSLCNTLKPLHAKKSVHRLLSPDKIFLTGGRTTLLQDLGLATWQYELGEGPKLYRAPEQISKGFPGPYTDVYQLGMILYHFITGTLPTSAQQVLPLRTWNSELSAELDAVLQRAIAFNLNERWRNAADFSSALKRVL
jgi:eukaryotic-like serine/threonine-protein kinase